MRDRHYHGSLNAAATVAAALLLAALVATTANATPILVAHYTLDDTGTTILDSSGNALNGTRTTANVSTGSPGVTHVEGSAAAAFGNSSAHSIGLGSPSLLDFLPTIDEFSISGWIKVPANATGTIFSKAAASNRQYQLFVHTDGTLHSKVGGPEASISTTVDDNAIHHVAMSVSTSGVTFYVDGDNKGTGSIGSTTNPGQTVYIGARSNGNGYKLTAGWIDDVQFYRGTLDDPHAQYLFNNPGKELPSESGLIYRETFPNDGTDTRTMGGGAIEGWRANYGDSDTTHGVASGSTGIGAGAGSLGLSPVNSNPVHASLSNGYFYREKVNWPYTYWTAEYPIDNVDRIMAFQWDLFCDHPDADEFRAVVRLDVNGTASATDDLWFASAETFGNGDGQATFTNAAGEVWNLDVTFNFAGADWLALDFRPNTSMALGAPTALPSGKRVTAFGLYTPSANNGHQRFDNFEVYVPEPTTLALLGIGLAAVARRRRRR